MHRPPEGPRRRLGRWHRHRYAAHVRSTWVVCALLGACDSGGGSSATASSSPVAAASAFPASDATSSTAQSGRKRQYPSAAWAKLRDDTQRGPAANGVVAVTRTLLAQITPIDSLGIAIRFESETGVFASSDAAGARRLDWSATLGKTQFHIETPEGTERVLKLSAPPKQANVSPLGQRPHVVYIPDAGLRQFAGTTPWAEPVSSLFGRPGNYRVWLVGELVLADKTVPLRTGKHAFVVVRMGVKLLPVDNLAGMAGRFVAKFEGIEAPLRAFGNAIDDVDHNVIVRFKIGADASNDAGAGHPARFVDVAMTPRGALLGAHRFEQKTQARDAWRGIFDREPGPR